MSSDRKLTVKRLVIFLVIAFIPFCVIVPIMWSYFGEPIYASENEDAAIPVYILGVFGMMIPSCANIITRLITREGFTRSYLGLHTKGKMGYWAASVFVPVAYSLITLLLIIAVFMGDMGISGALEPPDRGKIGLLLFQAAFSVIVFFPAFGEEWGWRGYMMPKLMELMPKPLAVFVGGIIWGLWHAPLTVAGHNFGVDYPGYPFVGIGLMCLMCVALNAFLTLLTEKTQSVYPAAFCHAVNNNLSWGGFMMMLGKEEALEKMQALPTIQSFFLYFCTVGVVGIISFVLLIKKSDTSAA